MADFQRPKRRVPKRLRAFDHESRDAMRALDGGASLEGLGP